MSQQGKRRTESVLDFLHRPNQKNEGYSCVLMRTLNSYVI